jgi:serine protease AprX
MAKKALLINSADAYTDGDEPGPDDPKYLYKGGHAPVMGSEWNRTYGWGYLNMQRAYDERSNLIHDTLTLKDPEKVYFIDLPVGGKVTLIHERRVGYSNSIEWKLSHLSLELLDNRTKHLVMSDNSAKDTVHQVANCERGKNERVCSSKTKFLHAVVKVSLLNTSIDGANEEPFVLAWSGP